MRQCDRSSQSSRYKLAALTKTMGEKVEPAQVGEVCGRYGIEFVRK